MTMYSIPMDQSDVLIDDWQGGDELDDLGEFDDLLDELFDSKIDIGGEGKPSLRGEGKQGRKPESVNVRVRSLVPQACRLQLKTPSRKKRSRVRLDRWLLAFHPTYSSIGLCL